jgi:hypothetical protein
VTAYVEMNAHSMVAGGGCHGTIEWDEPDFASSGHLDRQSPLEANARCVEGD